MPSVLGEVGSVMMVMPQMVKPRTPEGTMWNLPEFWKRSPWMVRPLLILAETRRGAASPPLAAVLSCHHVAVPPSTGLPP